MGGAERNARKKRQAQTTGRSPAVAAARKSGPDRKKVVVGVVVVVVLAVAVVGGVLIYNNQKNATEGENINAGTTPSATAPDYPVERDGGIVVVGQSDAKVTLEVYEDFLCPACRQFEETYAGDIEKYVGDGTVRVRYHMLPMLNERSDPPGYSMDSANAGLCAADAGQFPAYHKSLFGDQPEEGSRGWDDQQLAKLGTDLGITDPNFTSCVTSGKYDGLVQKNFDEVKAAPYLQQEFPDGSKGFGTPTLAVDEKVVDTAKADWLDQLVRSAA
ncbi:DsbA family protein [Actinophytocola algeriensis]|uniref:Protein-disulfide isomerase n=1 Tax=Actinophytocola algeriensis TaxID=1768010 RepID=A0A7W7Q5T2_9PSEU|nr:thioredoxin domain-containing protein [Actinophytocola algeriensis]MBB4907432.1 protein-disulfide isomerase [Actinophytocola algeriensis]MBE1479462.1 protein-disulfide isomerase [Actinophytocola algeriensis]